MKKFLMFVMVLFIGVALYASYNKNLIKSYVSDVGCKSTLLTNLGGVVKSGSCILKALVISIDGVTATDSINVEDSKGGTDLLLVKFPSTDGVYILNNLNIEAVNGIYLDTTISGGTLHVTTIYEE